MEIKAKAAFDFIQFDVTRKAIYGDETSNCLDKQAGIFTNLPFATPVLRKTSSSLGDAEKDAMSGDNVAIEKRDALEEVWDDQFRQTASYVSLVSNGNLELIKSANFKPTKTTRQKRARITNLKNFKAIVQSEKGTATASCKGDTTANGYIFLAASEGVAITMVGNDMLIDANGLQVRMKFSTVANVVFTGLTSEKRVNISALDFNTAGSSALTDAQNILPQ